MLDTFNLSSFFPTITFRATAKWTDEDHIVRKTSAKNEEDYGRSRVFDSFPLLMEQSSPANKTGNINRLFRALC